MNFEHAIHNIDISKSVNVVELAENQPIDIVIGGPPCQDFSHAGNRSEGKKAKLTLSYANVIEAVMPNWFVMENVDRAFKSDSYKKIRKIFKRLGYGLTEVVLDSSFYGVPQKRKRFFCIGKIHEEDGFLIDSFNNQKADERMTMRDYFGDQLGIDYYYRHPRNYNRRGIFSMDEPSPTVRGVNRPVPAGYPGHHGDPVDLFPELRPLSTLERSLVQTFPADFNWVGTKTNLEQMIGNAVPVLLAQSVAEVIENYQQTCDLAETQNLELAF